MAIIPKPNIILNPITGETLQVSDLTGLYNATSNPGGYFAPNISPSSVNATRFVWWSYLQQQQAGVVTDIVSGREFTVSGANLTFDTKTLLAGSTYILFSDGTPTGSGVMTTTGRFCSVTNFLPVQAVSSDFTPSLVGEDTTVFVDAVRTIQMDIYTTVYAAGTSRPAGTYIVTGTPGQTATVGATTYRVGEIIVSGSTFTNSGAASIVLFNATTPSPRPFVTDYYARTAISNLALKKANSHCGCASKLKDVLEDVEGLYAAIKINLKDDLSLSISGTQLLLQEILTKSEATCSC